MKKKPQALVVGINNYLFLNELRTPANDANAVAELLLQAGFEVRGLPSASSQNYWQVDPTQQLQTSELKNAIIDLFALKETSNRVTIPDTALLFFSGHGLRCDNGRLTTGYLATSRVDKKEDWGFSMKELWEILENSEVRQQIVILDCCHAGEFLQKFDPAKLEGKVDYCFIAACCQSKEAWEPMEGEYSFLTEALLIGLDQNENPEGRVTSHTLINKVEERLENTKYAPVTVRSSRGFIIAGKQSPRLPENMPSVNDWVESSRSQELKKLKAQLLNPDPTKSPTGFCLVGLPGIGKTTLASKLVRDLQSSKEPFEVVAWVSLAVANFDDIVVSLLSQLSETDIHIIRENTSKNTAKQQTEQVVNLFKRKRSIVVFDNVEPILTTGRSEKAGYFAPDCADYGCLFKQLVSTEQQSKVIFTSREKLVELQVKQPKSLKHENLKGLDTPSAIALLKSEKFELIATDEELKALAESYQGHPKALEIAAALIRDNYQRQIRSFLISDIREPSLDNLLDEVIERLSQEEKDCLTRISIYKMQSAGISSEEIAVQMQDVKANLWKQSVQSLQKRQLLDLSLDTETIAYKLHPFVQEKAYKILDQNGGVATAHKEAAQYYLSKAVNLEGHQNKDMLFEAFYYLNNAEDYEGCFQTFIFKILEAEESIENLRTCESLFQDTSRVIRCCKQLDNKLSDDKDILVAIVLGLAYTEVGKPYKAVEVCQRVIEYADARSGVNYVTNISKQKGYRNRLQPFSSFIWLFQKIRRWKIIKTLVRAIKNRSNHHQGNRDIYFLQVNARLVTAKAYRLIGNFPKAFSNCIQASQIAARSNYSQGRGLALYELGTIYLDVELGMKALRSYVLAAFLASWGSVAPEIYQLSRLLLGSLEEIKSRITEILLKYSQGKKQSDAFKKWRILLSVGQSLNVLNFYSLAEFFISESLKYCWDTDNQALSWSYSELARCYAGMDSTKQNEIYQKTYEVSKDINVLVKAKALDNIGAWYARKQQFGQARNTYEELNGILQNMEYKILQATAAYQLAIAYQKLKTSDTEELAREWCDRALEIAQRLAYEERENLDEQEIRKLPKELFAGAALVKNCQNLQGQLSTRKSV
jgi:GTPase SAR1 family protein